MILFILITSGLYLVISRNMVTDMKADELYPKALTISEFVSLYKRGEMSFAHFRQLIQAGPAAWDAWVFVLDEDGTMLVQTVSPNQWIQTNSFFRELQPKPKMSWKAMKFVLRESFPTTGPAW